MAQVCLDPVLVYGLGQLIQQRYDIWNAMIEMLLMPEDAVVNVSTAEIRGNIKKDKLFGKFKMPVATLLPFLGDLLSNIEDDLTSHGVDLTDIGPLPYYFSDYSNPQTLPSGAEHINIPENADELIRASMTNTASEITAALHSKIDNISESIIEKLKEERGKQTTDEIRVVDSLEALSDNETIVTSVTFNPKKGDHNG